MTDWRQLAARLADELAASGRVRSPEWIAAVREVPRHVFVPRYLEFVAGGWRQVDAAIESIYADVGRYTLVGPDPNGWGEGPLSSSSTPGLMTRMLEALDLRDGHRVLEIGTGTGYNVALLCHRLGCEHVFSVDIEPALVDVARTRLASIGYEPVLAARDGSAGLAEHAPFDRVVATCSVPAVPRAWTEQLTGDGMLLVDLQLGTGAGNLVLLRRTDAGASGRFDRRWATFMPLRHAADPQRRPAVRDRAETVARPSRIAGQPWHEPVWWFLDALTMPPGVIYGRLGSDGSFLDAVDGSWAEIEPRSAGSVVWEHGPTPLWARVEDAHNRWLRYGRPTWERFGLTVRGDRQRVWLDDEEDGPAWVLPDTSQMRSALRVRTDLDDAGVPPARHP